MNMRLAASIAMLLMLLMLLVPTVVLADMTIAVDPTQGQPGDIFKLGVDSAATCNPSADSKFTVYFGPLTASAITLSNLTKAPIDSLEPDLDIPTAAARVPSVKPGTYGVYWRCSMTHAKDANGSEIWGQQINGVPSPETFKVTAAAPDTATSGLTTVSRAAGGPPAQAVTVVLALTVAASLGWLGRRLPAEGPGSR